MTTPPVLFLVFNRPDTTARVFAAIREARPARLYVAADGPRAERENEAARCAEVRRIATAVDWPCEVKTLFRDANLGCRRAVSGAITWFFEHEPEGIILEDDTLPTSTFFSYCQILLNRYRDDKNILSITGYTHFPDVCKPGHYTSRYPGIWGWCTWQDRWQFYHRVVDHNINAYEDAKFKNFIRSWEYDFWEYQYEQAITNSSTTWDFQWALSHVLFNRRCVRPSHNLITNIGFGFDATHTTVADKRVEKNRGCEIVPEKLYRRNKTPVLIDERFFVRRYKSKKNKSVLLRMLRQFEKRI